MMLSLTPGLGLSPSSRPLWLYATCITNSLPLCLLHLSLYLKGRDFAHPIHTARQEPGVSFEEE